MSHRGRPSRARHLLRSYGLVVPLVALVAACGRGGDEAPPQPTPTSAAATTATTDTSVATKPTTKAPATTGSRPTVVEPTPAVIANGTHSVYLTGVDAARRTISVDVVQVIDPKSTEATTVCPEIARGDHDGYCVKNESSQLRTVPVADEASLQVLSGSDLRSVDMRGLAAARQGQKQDNLFRVTVSGGKVTSAKELFQA